MTDSIMVEVVYALPHRQVLKRLNVPVGTTVKQAIIFSNMANLFPTISLSKNKVGIFGRLVQSETILRDHDRVEIYRPLVADPKETRRRRADRKQSLDLSK